MTPFKKQIPLDTETETDETFVDAAGVVWKVFFKRITAAAGKFGNAGATTLAHGIAALKLDAPFNVEKVNCSNGTITSSKEPISFTADVTNINIVTTTDLHLYSGEVAVSYCKTTN